MTNMHIMDIMPIRNDGVLGLTSRRNVPQIDVIRARAKNVSDLLDATPGVERVVIFTDRTPDFWKNFESTLALPEDRDIEVELVNPSSIESFNALNTDMVVIDRYDPNAAELSDQKLVDSLKAPNLSDAAYRGVWSDYSATNVLGLPALAQKIDRQASAAAQSPLR